MEYVAHQMMFRLDLSLPSNGSIHQIHLKPTQTDSEPVPSSLHFSSGGNALFLCKSVLRIICLTWNNIKPVLSLAWSVHSWAGHMNPEFSCLPPGTITAPQPEVLSCSQVTILFANPPTHVSILNYYAFVYIVLFALNSISLLINLANPHFEMMQIKCH